MTDTATPAEDLAALRRRLIEQRLAGRGRGAGPVPAPAGHDGPLAAAQRRLWVLDQLSPGSVEYLVPLVLRLRGALDVPALNGALSDLAARHDVLRSRYPSRDGEPVMVVDEPDPAGSGLAALDVEGVDEAGLHDALDAEARQGFDLAAGPVWRARLFRLADDDHVLAMHLHHIVCDGWSATVLCGELGELYRAHAAGTRPRLPAPSQGYLEHARREADRLAGEPAAAALRWWREALAGLAPLDLPVDRPRTAPRDPAGRRALFTLPAATARAVGEVARRCRATPFVVLLAAYAVLLARLCGQDDLAIGTPVSGRTRRAVEDTVGLFVNTLALRCDLSGAPCFSELVARVRQTTLDALEHQEVPFDHVVQEAAPDRDLSRPPLVSALFVLEEVGGGVAARLGGLSVEEHVVPPRAVKAEISLGLRPGPDGALYGAVDYATALFDEQTARAFADGYVRLLTAALAAPERDIFDLDLLAPNDRAVLLRELNDTATGVDPQALHELVLAQAARTPDAVAVVADDGELTYGELALGARSAAARLARAGVRRGDVVGVCLHRREDLIGTMLGVLVAGAAYLPLDPEDPPARLEDLAAAARVRAVVTDRERAGVFAGAPVLDVADSAAAAPGGGADGDTVVAPEVCASDLAYVIYTSGSTGRPKAVMVDHGGIVNRIAWMQRRYRLRPEDRVLQKTPYTFDVSVWEFFWPLVVGARLVFAAPGAHRDPAALARTIDRHAISHIHFVPSMLDAFMTAVRPAPTSLRQVYCSGEALRVTTARRFAGWSSAALHNLYGPTEASVDVTAQAVDNAELEASTLPAAPIGRPIDNIRAYLLDERLHPVPYGVAGQIYLAGVGLARGYLGRPDLTAERFVPDPFAPRPGGRLYRTGDRGRWRRDGVIEFIGRVDGQVKLHGVRIEPGEIEARLAEHPDVAAVAVAVHRSGDGEQQLVAYVVARTGEETTPARLRAYLAERLPAALVPSRYVRLDRLPLTSSGKTDRRALPAPDTGRDGGEGYTAPSTALHETFVEVWSQVLGRDGIGIDDDFFALGGDSMRAIRVVGALRARQIAVSVADVFALRTIEALAGVATAPQARLDDLVAKPFSLVNDRERADLPAGVVDAYPLSQVQAGMLYELLTDEQRRPYHNVTLYHIDDGGSFEAAALRAAVADVVARHEALRTSFDLGRYGRPLQRVHETATAALRVEDLCGLDEAAQREIVRGAAHEERSRLFDLTRAPVWRLHAFRRSATAWTLAVVECHAIIDGWSHNSLLSELLARYRGHRDGSPAPTQAPLERRYADFIAMERAALEQEEDRGYWAKLLRTHETVRLPQAWGADRPGEPISVVEPLDADISARLRQLAGTLGVSPKAVFLAAFAKVMSPLSAQADFLLGLVTNGRPEVSGGDEVLGMYLNTVPLPMRRPDGTWRELVLAAAAAERAVWPHRRYPLPAMRSLVGHAQPLIEAVYNYLDFYLLDGSGVDIAGTEDDSPNEFPLQLIVLPGQLVLTARPERVDRDRLTALAKAHRRVLERMLADIDGPAGHTVLSDEERRLAVAAASPLAPALAPATLHGLVAQQTALTPEAIAITEADRSLSYAQLDAAAASFARRLAAHGCGPDRPVGLLMRRSLEMVVAILGILKAGAGYLPLDHRDPPARRAARLAATGTRLLVTDDPRADGDGVTVLGPPPLSGEDGAGAEPPAAEPDDLAYLIFTSGSTGGPKGVMIPHAGIVNYIQWLCSRDWLRPGERIVLKTPYTFDVSVQEIFWPLTTGATLVVAPEGLHHDPVDLAAFLVAQRVGHACFVPSMLDAFLEAVDAVPACLTEVYCVGEALRTSTVRRLRALSSARVHNLYGPTEASVIGTAFVVPAGHATGEAVGAPDVPIGRPVDNTQALVLDADLNLVPDGVPGHLHLGGAGLAYGYAGQPALTAAQFVPNPYAVTPGGRLYRTGDLARRRSDGTIEYLGRLDHQIKIGGVRIEPSEIESVLLGYPSVRGAVVVARGTGAAARLVGYVAGSARPEEIRSHAAAWLPPLLVPSSIVVLDELPMTSSGKVDRRALPDAGQAAGQAAFVAPRTDVEKVLARVWEEELGAAPIGIEDGFVDRGGHSLAAMRIAVRLRRDHGLTVSPAEIMVRRTIAALAAGIDGTGSTMESLPSAVDGTPTEEAVSTADGLDEGGEADHNLVWMRERPGKPALFCVHPGGGSAHWYEELSANLPDVPVAAFHHPGLLEPADADCSTERLARRYLRQMVAAQLDGAYRLFGWCGGAPIAWEMAAQLRARGAQVTLVLLDPVLQDATATVPGGPNLLLLTECDEAYAELRRETEPARQERLRERIALLLDDILIGGHDGAAAAASADEVWPLAVRSWRLQLETRLSYRYRPAPLAVELLASDELAGGIHEALAGLSLDSYLEHWRALATGGVRVHRVAGGGTSAMLPPHIAGLSALLGRLLAESRSVR